MKSKKKLLPILLLVFHLVQALNTAKGFVWSIISKTVVPFSNPRNFYALVNFDKAICNKAHFSKKSCRLSSAGPEI